MDLEDAGDSPWGGKIQECRIIVKLIDMLQMFQRDRNQLPVSRKLRKTLALVMGTQVRHGIS